MVIVLFYVFFFTLISFYFYELEQDKMENLLKKPIVVSSNMTHSIKVDNAAKYDSNYNILPFYLPLWPNTIEFFSINSSAFEGIPLIPTLYCNARSHKNFSAIMNLCMSIVMFYICLVAPLYLLTFGPNVSELLLLDLDFGTFQTVMLFGYALSMAFNSGMMMVPVFDIVI